MACGVDLKEIRNRVSKIADDFDNGDINIDEFESQLKILINSTKNKQASEQELEQVAQAIYDITVDDYGILPENSNGFLNLDNIKNLLTYVKSGETIKIDNDADIRNRLKDTEEAEGAKEASSDFLDNAYKSATSVREAMQYEANSYLFDALFVNRGSISSKLGVVATTEELNQNIRLYLEMLFLRICNYLNSLNLTDLSEEEQQALQKANLYNKTRNGYTASDNLEILQDLIDKKLSPDKMKSNVLRSLLDNPNKKALLDAYNANILLKHFDSYLKEVLGGAISINEAQFNLKTGDNKYSISDKTATVFNTWRSTEDINPGDEISQVVLLFVKTLPLYNWQGNSKNSIKHLTWQNYQSLIGEVKAIGFNKDSRKIRLSSLINDNRGVVFDSFDDHTKKIINEILVKNPNATVATLFNSVRRNPRRILSALFDVLCSEEMHKAHPELYKTFQSEQLDLLWSIYKGAFDSNSNSLRKLSRTRSELDYYAFLTLASDSVFKKSFLQYFRDKDGNLKVRHLKDLEAYRRLQQLKTRINVKNVNPIFKKYNIVGPDSTVTFRIPGVDFAVRVEFNSQRVQYLNLTNKGEVINEVFVDNNLLNNASIKQFIIDTLGLNLNDDLFTRVLFSKDNVMKDLLDLASIVLVNSYKSSTIIDTIKSKREKRKKITNILGEKRTLNSTTNRLDLLPPDPRITNILNTIVQAKLTAEGLNASVLVKDSEQASQSMQSLSNLLGGYGILFELLESRIDSATNELSIVTNPDLLLGHMSNIEYFDPSQRKTKKVTKFTVAELQTMAFMSNFVEGLLKTADDSVVGNNIVSFVASVNSDKNTISQLFFDLNTEVTLNNGTSKKIVDLNYEERREVICREFGTFYKRIFDNINGDFYKLGIENLREFNMQCQLQGINPSKELERRCLEYNLAHRQHPIELIQDVHYKTQKSGELTYNNVLLSQIYRYDRKFFSNYIQGNADITGYLSYDEFMGLLRRELLKSIVKNNIKFESNNLQIDEQLSSKYGDYSDNIGTGKWVSSSRMPIAIFKVIKTLPNGLLTTIARAVHNSTEVKLLASELGFKNYKELIDNENVVIQLNPLILQHNELDFWLTLSWMDCTVGSFIAHPGKKAGENSEYLTKKHIDEMAKLNLSYKAGKISRDEYEESVIDANEYHEAKLAVIQEAAMYQDQHKRNVLFTAQMHQFQLNQLNGIPEEYNISVIRDIKDIRTILERSGCKIKPYDGATFVNPFVVYLENNSLAGARAGFDKKQFVHAKSHTTGTSLIIKTAGFAITNDRIRQSPKGWGSFMKLSTDHQWFLENGGPANLNILKNFRGVNIEYKPIYFLNNGEFFKIDPKSIVYKGNNTYDYEITLVDSKGKDLLRLTPEESLQRLGINTKGIVLDTNYKLWLFFGGAYSLQKDNNGYLKKSETSIENVVTAINNVGVIRQGYIASQVESQNELYQPLKYADIHYMPTEGAVKEGLANVNSADVYNNPDATLNFQKIKMYNAGIQLDKEHHADNSELSLPTQIVSACAALGYTIDYAQNLYESLAGLANTALSDVFKSVDPDGKLDRDKLNNFVANLIINELADSKSDSFARDLAKNILEKFEENKVDLNLADFPFSDKSIFNKLVSTIASTFSKKAIKLKVKGILSVLTPSFDLFKLYGGTRTYDSLYNWTEKDKALVDEYVNYWTKLEYAESIPKDKAKLLLAAIQYNSKEHPVYLKTYKNDSGDIDEEINNYLLEKYKDDLDESKIDKLKREIGLRRFNKKDYDESEFPFELQVLNLLANGSWGKGNNARKVKWEGAHNLGAELGLLHSKTEKQLRRGYISDSTGVSFGELVHYIYKSINKDWYPNITDQDVRNEIIGLFHNYDSLTSLKDSFKAEVIDFLISSSSEVLELDRARDYTIQQISEEFVELRNDLNFINSLLNSTKEVDLFVNDIHKINLDRTYIIEYNDGRAESKFLGMPSDLRELKKLISTGAVKTVYESMTDEGRNLGSFNVRASAYDEVGNRINFQLWELDAVYYVQLLLDIVNNFKGDEREVKFNEWFVNTFNLNPRVSSERALKLFRIRMIQELKAISKSTPDEVVVTIDGVNYTVDKSTIETDPYELIMSKTFIHEFGFDEFTDLNEVKEDPYYFVKLFLNNLRLNQGKIKPSFEKFDIELLSSNGHHTYLLDHKHLPKRGLRNITNSILLKKINGKLVRVDSEGNEMYEVLSNTLFYTDKEGNEIIVVKGKDDEASMGMMSYYVKSLDYDTINLSLNLKEYGDYCKNLVENHLSKVKKIKDFIEEDLTSEGENTSETYLNKCKELFLNNISADNFKNYLKNKELLPILKAGLRKHTSFLKSLEVVAGRIPAQNLQSFMPMKIVAYDNPNRNNAYVSNLLILLQGSKFKNWTL